MRLMTGPLVRAIRAQSVVIWAELTESGTVTLTVTPEAEASSDAVQSLTAATTTVGGHHYVALQLNGLTPATWYRYALLSADLQEVLPSVAGEPVMQCFRTLAVAGDADNRGDLDGSAERLRIAYGSCRKAERTSPDVLSNFGNWLVEQQERRAESWPQLMLLIGDQIYADQPPAEVVRERPQMAQGASNYEDFAYLYHYVWTNSRGTRQALAAMPSYMIFDDHEITNNWNCSPTSRRDEIEAGREQLLIDGEVAYWVYQGWGNLDQQQDEPHPLLTIMREAAQSGEDALERLRIRVRADVYKQEPLTWHYQIPSDPPIFVANARTERSALLQPTDDIYAPTQMVSEQQMDELQHWLAQQAQRPAILVSSVPVLLPPAIGAIEYLTGQRPWHKQWQALHWLGRQLARVQLRLADKGSFDHWPLYALSWPRLVAALNERAGDTFILSGDVHFSYALQAQPVAQQGSRSTVYQLVSTPLQNELSDSNKLQIKLQSYIKSANYGGLRQKILPLTTAVATPHVQRDLLYTNTIALLSVQTQPYILTHQYLGAAEESLHIVATTDIP